MNGSAPVPPGIFKAYDVRGLYGEEMDGETAYLLGRAFARVLARDAGQGAPMSCAWASAATCACRRPR